MKKLIAVLLTVCMLACLFVGVAYATETTDATEATEISEAAEAAEAAPVETADHDHEHDHEHDHDHEETAAPAPVKAGSSVLRTILLVMQVLSCIVLTAVIAFQSSKEGGMGALTGGSNGFGGNKKAASMDAKLSNITKWIAVAFVLLTLIVSLLYTVA